MTSLVAYFTVKLLLSFPSGAVGGVQVGGGAELRLGVNNLLDALRNLLTNLQPVANMGETSSSFLVFLHERSRISLFLLPCVLVRKSYLLPSTPTYPTYPYCTRTLIFSCNFLFLISFTTHDFPSSHAFALPSFLLTTSTSCLPSFFLCLPACLAACSPTFPVYPPSLPVPSRLISSCSSVFLFLLIDCFSHLSET